MPIRPQMRPAAAQLIRIGTRQAAPSPSVKLNSRAFPISRIQNTSTSPCSSPSMAATMTARYPLPKQGTYPGTQPGTQPGGRPILAACQQFASRGPVSAPSHSSLPTHSAYSRTAASPLPPTPCNPVMRMMGEKNCSPFSSTTHQRVQASTPHSCSPSRQTNPDPDPSQRRLSADLSTSSPRHRAPQRLCSSLPNRHDPSSTNNRVTPSSSSHFDPSSQTSYTAPAPSPVPSRTIPRASFNPFSLSPDPSPTPSQPIPRASFHPSSLSSAPSPALEPDYRTAPSRLSRFPQQGVKNHSPVFTASTSPRCASPAKPILKKVYSDPNLANSKQVRFSAPMSEKEEETQEKTSPTTRRMRAQYN